MAGLLALGGGIWLFNNALFNGTYSHNYIIYLHHF
jgi:hypothetical protein